MSVELLDSRGVRQDEPTNPKHRKKEGGARMKKGWENGKGKEG